MAQWRERSFRILRSASCSIFTNNLKTRLALLFGGLTVALTAIVVALASSIATQELSERVGLQLEEVSLQLRDKVELQIAERYTDLAIAAKMSVSLLDGQRYAEMTDILEELQANFSDYAWIGFVSTSGEVMASAGGLLLGADVSQRPWFREGLKGAYLGDIHKALLLEKLINPHNEEPLRFIDVAVPVINSDGEKVGVMGAHLDLKWIQQMGRSLLDRLRTRLSIDLLIANTDGELILGADRLKSSEFLKKALATAANKDSGYFRAALPDGAQQLVGYSRLREDSRYDNLNWAVMVYKPVAKAFAPVVELRNAIILAGVGTAVFFCLLAWFAAHRLTRPLLKLAREAEALNQGRLRKSITLRNDFTEVETLTRALRRPVDGLVAKEQQLTALNVSLEQRVENRTLELESANEALRAEMGLREKLHEEREELVRKLEYSANTDALTGAVNRRYLFESGVIALKRASRHRRPLSVMMFDVDHFKKINDTYGHGVGDDALCHLVDLARQTLRDIDLLARIGGEEFAVVLEDADEDQAAAVAERLRKLVESTPMYTDGLVVDMRVSIGVTAMDSCQESSLEPLLARADKALYEAKRSGRNRIVRASACCSHTGR
jgi:diguanylate cyclase